MSYSDALADCLAALRAGYDLEAAVQRHPRYAATLRGDGRLAMAVRGVGATLQPPAGAQQRGSQRLALALQQSRTAAMPRQRRGSWLGGLWGLAKPIALTAGLAVVVLIVAMGLMGNIASPFSATGTAEAATVEGVVVDNSNGVLSVQTAQGVQKVALGQDAAIADDASHALKPGDIEAGQLVRISARKTAQGLVARTVDRRALDQLESWCSQHGDPCTQVEPQLEQQMGVCQTSDQACVRLKQRLQDLKSGLQQLGQLLHDDDDRCTRGGASACKDLTQQCQKHPGVCQGLRLRQTPVPSAPPTKHR